MRVRTTEELKRFVEDTMKETNTNSVFSFGKLYSVCKCLNYEGELINDKPFVAWRSEKEHYINKNGRLSEKEFDWQHSGRYKRRIASDTPSGRCNLLPADYAYFTTLEEAEEYARNYTVNHKDEYIKALKNGENVRKKAIADWEKAIKNERKLLNEITKKLKEAGE